MRNKSSRLKKAEKGYRKMSPAAKLVGVGMMNGIRIAEKSSRRKRRK